MGSLLGQVLAGIPIVHFEKSLIPWLTAELSFWKRYMDNPINFIKTVIVDYILSMLNNFHPNIQIPYEVEYNLN